MRQTGMRARPLVPVVLLACVACTTGTSPSGMVSVIATSDRTAGTIIATIANDSNETIFVPKGDAWCASFDIERLDQAADPAPVDTCKATPTNLEAIEPGGRWTEPLAIDEPRVIVGSASPVELDVDLRDLPVEAPPASGDLVPRASEMPIGILPSANGAVGSVRSPTLGQTQAPPVTRLAPGTYRLRLRYLVGSPSGPEGSAMSEPFTLP